MLLSPLVIQLAIEKFFEKPTLERQEVDGAIRYTVVRWTQPGGNQKLHLKIRVINDQSAVYIDQQIVQDEKLTTTIHETQFYGITGVSVGYSTLGGDYLEFEAKDKNDYVRTCRLYMNCSVYFSG